MSLLTWSGRTLVWTALALVVVALSEVLLRLVLGRPALVEFQPLVVVLALAVGLAAGAVSGTRPGVVAGALGGVYAVTVLVRFSSDPSMVVRLLTGAVVGVTIFALSTFVGWTRVRHERLGARVLAAEQARAQVLETHNRELASTNRVLRDFAHVVAHDLKEPVRGIDVMLEALADDEGHRLSEEGRSLLAQARAADRRLAALVDALLDYARATRVEPSDLRPVDVRETLASEECRARFANLADERHARVEAPAPGTPTVLAAPNVMGLVLGNLVSNAIRHNASSEPLVRVRVEPASGGRVAVVVEDNGPGFSQVVLERIDAVVRGHEQQVGAGRSGFGLMLVARAVERMGGGVSVGRSELGGARVCIDLPSGDGAGPAARGGGPASPEAALPLSREVGELRGPGDARPGATRSVLPS